VAYITAEELRDELSSASEVVLPLDTALFDELVEQVSEAIDQHCYRTFEGYEIDALDDIANTTGLAVAVDNAGDGSYSTALAVNTGYVLETNRLGMVTAIRSTGRFPYSRYRPRTVKVTARYGWPAVPGPVKRAALIWGIRLWNRRSTPSGVVGFGDFGAVRLTKIDPDVSELLAPYRDRGSLLR
jgi:hypothetical protein